MGKTQLGQVACMGRDWMEKENYKSNEKESQKPGKWIISYLGK